MHCCSNFATNASAVGEPAPATHNTNIKQQSLEQTEINQLRTAHCFVLHHGGFVHVGRIHFATKQRFRH